MHSLFSRFSIAIATILLIIFSACDEHNDSQPFLITGKITADKSISDDEGNVFASILRGGGQDMTARDLSDAFEGMTRVASDGTFSMDLSETGLTPGDTVTLVGFVDSNGNGGIPTPDEGDFMGFYIQEGSFTPSYTLQNGINSGADIHVSREVFDYEKEITGTIIGEYTGPVHLFAYAGDIRSLDLTTLDVDGIIGYGSFEKKKAQLDYHLTILPYGYDLPIPDVTAMAIFDTNGNGSPDPGESVGYYSMHPKGLPTLLTLTTEEQDTITLDSDHAMVLPAPAGEAVSLTGRVEPPDGYDENSAPLFVIVAEAENPKLLLAHPLSVTRAFYRLDPAAVDFNLDLSSTGLAPGDTVMVIALWDKNFKKNPDTPTYTCFPEANDGDLLGYYQDKATLTMAHTLHAGVNAFVPLAEGNPALRFQVNRKLIDHDASLVFQFQNGGGVTLAPGDQLLVVAVQKGGVDNATYQITDPDYIVATKSVTATGDTDDLYSVRLMGALLETIVNTPFGVDDVYVFAILDKNGNGEPDSDEPVGFYRNLFFPVTTNMTNGENLLDRPVSF